MKNVTKYIVSGVIATGVVTGGIVLVAFFLFQPEEGDGPEEELFIFDFAITSHQNDSLVQSSTIVLRGTTSGSSDINQIVINGISVISLEPNFLKWGVILNLIHGVNQIHINITYNITSVIQNAVDFRINADTGAFPKDLDRPDSSYQDPNNDGLDGMCDNAIFVSKSGEDLNSGTIFQPMLTINAGVAIANESGTKDVYVSEGAYNESIVMIDGVSLFGGYKESDLWSRDTSNHPIINATEEVNNRIVGVTAHNIQAQTYLDTMEIRTANSTTGSSCGVWCYNISDDLLNINNCIISSGDGRDGNNGANGDDGIAVSNGFNGVNWLGGSGGLAPGLFYDGGNGGNGHVCGLPPPPWNGIDGISGEGPGGGIGGIGGAWGPIPGNGGNGGDGANGANGADGGVGDGNGTIVNNFWRGFNGNDGMFGYPGSGGGGGGGGGSNIVASWGGGGGGGGGGGTSGFGGKGGKSGGGSIGILLVEANIIIAHNTIFTGDGGNGDNGGRGGSGGLFGFPGSGLLGGVGGLGGLGGDGGDGGSGGGGTGGISFGIYCYDSIATISDNLYTIGTGGLGGLSLVNNGVQGESGDVYL